MPSYSLKINGVSREVVSYDPNQPLLYVLRSFGLNAAKFGCGLGQCGACMVMIDRKAVPSCTLPISAAKNKSVTTLEGLKTGSKLHPLQAAFIKEQVPQCGYCTSGIIMSAAALLAQKKKPSETDVRAALEPNLCRCGTHARVVRAVMSASGQGA